MALPRHLDPRKASDRDVARELIAILHYHPWSGLSAWALAKRIRRSSKRVRRVLEADPIFTINYRTLVDEQKTHWMLADRYWSNLPNPNEVK